MVFDSLKSDLILDELTTLFLKSSKDYTLKSAKAAARKMFNDIEKLVIEQLTNAKGCIDKS